VAASTACWPGGEAGPYPKGEQVQAMVLLRAPSRAPWLAGAAEAIAEMERLAGLDHGHGGSRSPQRWRGSRLPWGGSRDPWAGLRRMGSNSRLSVGPPVPGLMPVAPVVARAGLEAAGTRGLPAPPPPWRPAAGPVLWRPSAGAVVTCEGPRGASAQAVLALRGLGNALAITPPPGGALVLRAWRAGRTWGMACGLVIGAETALGLGREAGRVAARLRADGWHAAVLNGPAALHLARAGSPDELAADAAARAASARQVATLFEACLLAGGIDPPAARSRWALAITP
jgi:hypothetical protein